jgi:hypothetical protein
MPNSDEAAVSAAHELLGVEAPEATEVEASGAEHEVPEVDFPSFDIELPPELAAELAEPEVDLSVEDDEQYHELVETYGEENNELITRMRAAEKKAEHFERLRLTEAKKNWAEEAKQYFPLAEPFLEEIQATSKRGYLRTAKQVHEKMLPIVEERVLKPARAAIEQTKAETITETKEELRDAWGQPITQRPPSEAAVTTEVAHARRRRGELSDTIRNMVFAKPQGE